MRADWEGVASTFYRAPLVTTKSGTTLTDFAARPGGTGVRQDCYAQFVSAPLAAAHDFVKTEECSWVVRGLEMSGTCNAHNAGVVRVVSGDGSTERGVIYSRLAATTELSTSAATRILDGAAISAVSASKGDRIVVEMGSYSGALSTDYDVTWRFGDPSGVDDFALTHNLTTDLCPWVEIAADLTFSSAARIFVPDFQGGLESNLTGGI